MGPRRSAARLAAGVVAIAIALAVPVARAETPAMPNLPAQPEQAVEARIEGFRSAHFGMSEIAVRGAIADDFHLSGAAVNAAKNPVQRTAVLRIRIADPVADGGTAEIDYIFGYRSHTLIEVNVLWSAAIDAKISPARLVANGAALQAYFERQGFAPDRTAQNAVLPDGNVLLFRAQDAGGHAVVLLLSGRRDKPAKDASSRLTPTALTLAYAADPAHPDVFQLKKGTF